MEPVSNCFPTQLFASAPILPVPAVRSPLLPSFDHTSGKGLIVSVNDCTCLSVSRFKIEFLGEPWLQLNLLLIYGFFLGKEIYLSLKAQILKKVFV